MFNYSINFSLQVDRLLPTFLRLSKTKAYAEALIMPTVDGHIFDYWYVFGIGNFPVWDLDLETNKGDRVRRHSAVYEQISEGALTGYAPEENSGNFKLVIDDFRGYQQRLRHNSQKLVLEYILNQWFNTQFRQPSMGGSDIYIELQDSVFDEFWIGETAEESGWIAGDNVSLFYSLIHDEADAYTPAGFDFVVKYPSAFTGDQVRELEGIVERLKICGVSFGTLDY